MAKLGEEEKPTVRCPACGLKFTPRRDQKYISCPSCDTECGQNPSYLDKGPPPTEHITFDQIFKKPKK